MKILILIPVQQTANEAPLIMGDLTSIALYFCCMSLQILLRIAGAIQIVKLKNPIEHTLRRSQPCMDCQIPA